MQREFYGLVPDAMETLRYSLQVEKNAKVGYRVLEGTGVAPHQGERMQLPPTSEENLRARQDRLVAAVITQRHRDFDIPLPVELKEALEKGKLLEVEEEDARAAGVKLPRR